MNTITVQEIQRDPQAFVGRLEAGESLTVVRGEIRIAEIRPTVAIAAQPRPFGLCAGQFHVPEHFDDSLPEEVLREFEGE